MTNPSNISFLILAAGKGSRMNSEKPKVLHKVFNTTILNLLIENATEQNNDKISIVISEEGRFIEKTIESNKKFDYIIQKERLGTAHAVKTALTEGNIADDGTLIILYGDSPFISSKTVSKLTKKIEMGNLATVAAFNCEVENQYGRLCVNGDELERIVEYKDANKEEKKIKLCNSGIMALNLKHARRLISKINNNNNNKEYYLTDIIEEVNKTNEKASFVEVEYNEVQGINNKVELANASKYYFAVNRKKALDNGVTLIDPDTSFLGHAIEFGKDVVIEPNVTIFAHSKIGDRVTIKSHSYIEEAIIKNDITIGPFARIRPNTEIKNKVKIGNFVEIKNSVINTSSKINHFSYIGDSEIGESVNIGAGTITCNYDGFKKHKTIIKDKVFIGSNSSLVAPLTIGEGSIIGAGSTITSDITSNSVTISRCEQKNIADAREFRKKKNT